MPLTKRQREILNYLATYSEQNGYAPSFEEIAESFSYSSLATVHEHLSNLERKGYIKRAYNESRAIEILPSEATPRALELPILGSVAAGQPIERMLPRGMALYAGLCGWTLARAHARSGDRVTLAAYLGGSDKFDNAIAEFAEAYADENERDYAALAAAVLSGRAHAQSGL